MKDKNGGWIKIYRKILDDPVVNKDSDTLAIWLYLLLNATHTEYPVMFKGKKITLKPGQLLVGRKSLAAKLRINEMKIYRTTECFESEHLIEQQKSNRNTLITILKWNEYQQSEHLNEQPVNNKLNTNKNVYNKNVKNKRESVDAPTLAQVKNYVREMKYTMDPEAFFDYYSATEWRRKNGTPIKDWQAAVRSWERREKEFRKENGNQGTYKPNYYAEYKSGPKIKGEQMPDELKKKWLRSG